MARRWQFALTMQLRQLRTTLSCSLIALLPFGVLAPGCSSGTASKGQLITCTTDPGTGVILRCEPTGTGSGTGSGTGTCQDIDEDGDGEPHDDGDDNGGQPPVMADGDHHDDGDDHDGGDDDRDHDGIHDGDDCDEHAGEDGHREGLPYDVRPRLGSTTQPIIDAFTARGGQPAAIVSVAMEGSSWRLAELKAGTAFVVTEADCNHPGNRSAGRDRVFVTWKNADQSQSSDHLDIRYCH